jgi:PBP1b-binding outer membrane lipoprotein LpoB
MSLQLTKVISMIVGLSVLLSGCTEFKVADSDSSAKEASEQTDLQKISQSITLIKMLTQKMQFEHNRQSFKGIEYQIYFQLPAQMTDVKTINRIEIEVSFSGKTKEIMNIERVRKPLQLHKAEHTNQEYMVRIPSVYRTDYSEEELNYLLDHVNEVHTHLYIDNEPIRDLK